MREEMQVAEVDDEISIWELLEALMAGWRWWVGGAAVGLLAAIGFLGLTPAKYEATAVVQPATIGAAVGSMLTANPASPANPAEPLAQTLERLKLVSFYSDDEVKACQTVSAQNLAGDVKASIVKSNSLLSISYRASSAELAKACMSEIVGRLTAFQSTLAAPLIKELTDQQAATKQQIDDTVQFLAQHEKSLATAPTGAVLLTLRREELMKLQKLDREQRIQLTEPLTQPMKLLEPIYAADQPVSPKRLLTAGAGLMGGLMVGLLALIGNRGWRRYKSMAGSVAK